MIEHVELQQGRFEKITGLLQGIYRHEGDGMSVVTRALIEDALTEAALGSEDAQLALDREGDKKA